MRKQRRSWLAPGVEQNFVLIKKSDGLYVVQAEPSAKRNYFAHSPLVLNEDSTGSLLQPIDVTKTPEPQGS